MNIPIITVCSHPEHAQALIASAGKKGWDLHVIKVEWAGFGTKLIATRDFLIANPDITHFVFADAFDVVVLGNPEEFEDKIVSLGHRSMVCSTEKNCWPVPDLAKQYPDTSSPFKYLNSGLYYSPRKLFLKMMEDVPPKLEDDDQLYLTQRYLSGYTDETNNHYGIKLDYFQNLFNSHSFIEPEEYDYVGNRLQVLGNQPVFVHFNGKTVDEVFNEKITI